MNPHDDPKLERLVHQTLRELPARRAPATLEQRVMAEIARRAALPWWKQNFAAWPAGVRVAFLAVSGLVIAGILWLVGGFDAAPVRAALATPLAWIDTVAVLGRTLRDFVTMTLNSVPPLWLYGGLAIVAALYTTLFGLGAAAYRTLYANR
jgi:hypothetical protein